MRKFTQEAKIGLFFLACVAIIAFTWFRVLDLRFEEGFELKARFRSVEGLVEGAQVQISGIKIGKVKTIRYDQESGKAMVVMEIKSEYLNAIPEDSRVFIKTKGLIGDKYIVIEPGKPNARKLGPGDSFDLVYEPVDTEKTFEKLGVMTQDLQELASVARKQVVDKKGAQRVDAIINDIGATFKDLKEILHKNKDKIHSTLNQADKATKDFSEILKRNKNKINRTIDDVDIAAKNLSEIASRNRPKINRAVDGMEKFGTTFDKTGRKFDRLADRLEKITKDIDSGKGTLGKLLTDESLHRDASALVRDLRQLSDRIQNGSGAVSRLINDPELYYEARRAIRNMNKTAEDVSEATPVSTLAIILGSVFR